MKVLHIETGKHLYGGARQVAYIIAGLRQQGVSNLLAAPADSAMIEAAEKDCSSVIPLQTNHGTGYSLYKEILATLESQRPDIVHIHSRRLAVDFWGGLAAKKIGIPAVLSRRVDNPEARGIVKLKYRLYPQIITISEGIRQVLISEGLAAEKITTVRSAVDIRDYSTECHRAEFLQEFSLPETGVTLAVIAQLIPRKGHRYLLEILPEISRHFPDVRVLFFGQGPLEAELKQEVENAGLQDIVQFTGFRKDLTRWLPCIDIVVHPAEMEGLGVSLIQAAASAVPVIASRAGGMPEIVHDRENGLLIEPGDTHALSESLVELLKDKSLRQEMGRRGRKLAETGFSIEVMVAGNLAVYHQLLAQPA